MEIDYYTSYHSFSNQHSIYGNSPFFRDRHQAKSNNIKKHHNEIFNVYVNWISQSFLTNIDISNFDMDSLFLNIKEQIIPIDTSSNRKLTSLWNKAISHLNCGDYVDAYEKFKEIEGCQKNFNDSMKKFLDKHKEYTKKILMSIDTNPSDESLKKLLRYIFCKSKNYYRSPLPLENQLDCFRPFLILKDNTEITVEISNPFPEKERELINYLKGNYDEIIISLIKFEEDVKNVKNSINDIKNKLILIEQNRIEGLKGNCSVEKKGVIGKIKYAFHRKQSHVP